MSLAIPNNARGPLVTLTLPEAEDAFDVSLRNVTSEEQLTINVPEEWDGSDLVLDFYQRTIEDSEGNDKSALLDPLDHILWTTGAIRDGDTLTLEARAASPIAKDDFDGEGSLEGREDDAGNEWTEDGEGPAFAVQEEPAFAVLGGVLQHAASNGSVRVAEIGIPDTAAMMIQVTLNYASRLGGAEILARTSDAGYLWAQFAVGTAEGGASIRVTKVIGETGTVLQTSDTGILPIERDLLVRLAIGDDGKFLLTMSGGAPGATPEFTASGQDDDLATGGDLASGKVAIRDQSTEISKVQYKRFRVFPYQVAYAVSAEIGWEQGYF